MTGSLQIGADTPVTNTTHCQDPIENFETEVIANETEQAPDWGPDLWVDVSELVTLKATKTMGHPVNWFVDWYQVAEPVYDSPVNLTELDDLCKESAYFNIAQCQVCCCFFL